MATASPKTNPGNHFENFAVGQRIQHAMPITIAESATDNARGLYGSRLIVPASSNFAASVGYDRAPVSNMVAFHNVFGLTVPDISKNARANLGYAEVKLKGDVHPGDTLTAETEIIGLKQNSNGKTGNVYVHTTAANQNGEEVISFKRWVMVNKKDLEAESPKTAIPELEKAVDPNNIVVSPNLQIPKGTFDTRLTGASHAWEDYEVGEKIDHDARVEMDSDHTFATRLAGGNNSAVHFVSSTPTPDGGKAAIIYGGHIMQHAFAQTNNGLENMLDIVAINGGAHTAPTFVGDSIQSYSEILDKAPLPGRDDIALLRVRTVAAKNLSEAIGETFPSTHKKRKYTNSAEADAAEGKFEQHRPHKYKDVYDKGVVLDLDYWVTVPTAKSMIDPNNPPPANHTLNPDPNDPVFQFDPKPERAVHFFPPHVDKMFGKAQEMVGNVDVLLGNFEDGVGPDKKVDARNGFIKFAQETDMQDTGLWTRINALDTEWGKDDVREIVSAVGDKIDVIMLPMVRNAAEVHELDKMLTILEAEHGITKPIRIHAILETGDGIVNVNEIAAASPRMHGMSFGPADYAASMGIKTQDVGGSIPNYGVLTERNKKGALSATRDFVAQDVWHYHISAMVAACRAEGLKPMYGPFGNFGDDEACEQQFTNAYLMGCEGTWTLHPKQIATALDVFAPDPSEVAVALERIQTFETNGNVSYFERATGKFVDEAVIKQADVFVQLAQQLADKDPKYAELYGLNEADQNDAPALTQQ